MPHERRLYSFGRCSFFVCVAFDCYPLWMATCYHGSCRLATQHYLRAYRMRARLTLMRAVSRAALGQPNVRQARCSHTSRLPVAAHNNQLYSKANQRELTTFFQSVELICAIQVSIVSDRCAVSRRHWLALCWTADVNAIAKVPLNSTDPPLATQNPPRTHKEKREIRVRYARMTVALATDICSVDCRFPFRMGEQAFCVALLIAFWPKQVNQARRFSASCAFPFFLGLAFPGEEIWFNLFRICNFCKHQRRIYICPKTQVLEVVTMPSITFALR